MAERSLPPEGDEEEMTSASSSQLLEEQIMEITRWRKPSDENKWCDAEITDYNFPVKKTATKSGLFLILFSIGLNIFDVGSDIVVAIFHFIRGRILSGSLTLAIVFFNSLTVRYLSIKWHKEYERENHLLMPWWYRYLCFLGPLPASAFAFHYGRKSIQLKKENNENQSEMYFKKMSDLLYVGSKLSVIEAIMESSPQFVLQIYLYHNIGDESPILPGISLFFSWLSLIATMATSNGRGFFSNVRFVDKEDTSRCDIIDKLVRLSVNHLLFIVARAVYFSALALCASAFWFWVLVLVYVIVILVINWRYGKFNEINKMTTDRIERIVLGIVYVVSILLTDFEMKPLSRYWGWRKIIVWSVVGLECLAIFGFFIYTVLWGTTNLVDDHEMILLIMFGIPFFFLTVISICNKLLFYYVAIKTRDGYVFVIETKKPIIGQHPKQVEPNQETPNVQMNNDSNPSIEQMPINSPMEEQ